MDDDELKPMTDGETGASAAPRFEPDAPAKDAEPQAALPAPEPKTELPPLPTSVAEAKQQAKDGAGRLTQQAGDKARSFVDQGKERATGALEQLSKMLTDAADQVDEKLGGQYGKYARDAADTVQGYADQLRDKPSDDLVEEARVLVRKSPGVAIGAAAALGFVVARLVSAGLDQRDA